MTALGIMNQYLSALKSIGFVDEELTFDAKSIEKKSSSIWSETLMNLFALSDFYNLNSHQPKIVLSAISAGLYPNIMRVETPETKFKATIAGAIEKDAEAKEIRFKTKKGNTLDSFFLILDVERVFVHPSSVLFPENKFWSPWVVYLQKQQTSKVFIYDCSIVSSYSVVLFGGKAEVDHSSQLLSLDGWIKFRVSPRVAALIRKLRRAFEDLLLEKFKNPSAHICDSPINKAILSLVLTDGTDERL
jgi:ATP-dependent RNA helicase DHX57